MLRIIKGMVHVSDDLYVTNFETNIPSTIYTNFPYDVTMDINVWNDGGSTVAANGINDNFRIKVKSLKLKY